MKEIGNKKQFFIDNKRKQSYFTLKKCFFCKQPFLLNGKEDILKYIPEGTSKKWEKYLKDERFPRNRINYFHLNCWLSYSPELRRQWLELDFKWSLDVPYNSPIAKIYQIIYNDEKNKEEIIPNKWKTYKFLETENLRENENEKSFYFTFKQLSGSVRRRRTLYAEDFLSAWKEAEELAFSRNWLIWEVKGENNETYFKKIKPKPKPKPKGISSIYRERECKECDKVFKSLQYNHIYCSNECRRKVRDRRLSERYKLPLERKCKICGKTFIRKKQSCQIYCSHKCKKKARKRQVKYRKNRRGKIYLAQFEKEPLCRVCYSQLVPDNWYPSFMRINSFVCIECWKKKALERYYDKVRKKCLN